MPYSIQSLSKLDDAHHIGEGDLPYLVNQSNVSLPEILFQTHPEIVFNQLSRRSLARNIRYAKINYQLYNYLSRKVKTSN